MSEWQVLAIVLGVFALAFVVTVAIPEWLRRNDSDRINWDDP